MEDEIESKEPARPDEGATSSPSPAPSSPLDVEIKRRVRATRSQKRREALKTGKGGRPLKVGENPNAIGGKPKGVKQPHLSPKVKRTRNELMLAAHLTGTTIGEVAEMFGVSRLTASEGITDAQRATYFGDARDYVRFRLIPKSLRVLDAALDAGDVDVASRIAEGAHVIGGKAAHYDPSAASITVSAAGVTNDFESYRLELIRRRSISPGVAKEREEGASGSPAGVIDAEAVEAGLGEDSGE